MSIIPGLVREKIDYYMWWGRVRDLNMEYHKACREHMPSEDCNDNRISCIVWYNMVLIGYRRLDESNVSHDQCMIYNFVKFIDEPHVGFIPKKYVWSNGDKSNWWDSDESDD